VYGKKRIWEEGGEDMISNVENAAVLIMFGLVATSPIWLCVLLAEISKIRYKQNQEEKKR